MSDIYAIDGNTTICSVSFNDEHMYYPLHRNRFTNKKILNDFYDEQPGFIFKWDEMLDKAPIGDFGGTLFPQGSLEYFVPESLGELLRGDQTVKQKLSEIF